MGEFFNTLLQNAYAELDVTGYEVDLQGWKHERFDPVITDHLTKLDKPEYNIIEVGSWKGMSIVAMADICKKMGRKANIIAVDTWLGSPEFWIWGQDAYKSLTKTVHGYPSVYYTFLKNVKTLGHSDIIAPLPIASVQGAKVLSHYGFIADLIYIDAAHEYEPVLNDITSFWNILKPGGIMCGDDYHPHWHGVMKAVDQFAQAMNLRVYVDGVVWTIFKPAVANT